MIRRAPSSFSHQAAERDFTLAKKSAAWSHLVPPIITNTGPSPDILTLPRNDCETGKKRDSFMMSFQVPTIAGSVIGQSFSANIRDGLSYGWRPAIHSPLGRCCIARVSFER